MIQHHKWSLHEIESMTPWERDVYSKLLIAHMKEEAQRAKDSQAKDQKVRQHGP